MFNVLASYLEQEPVNATTGFVLLSGHTYQNSIDSSLSGVSDHLHTVAISDHSFAHAASSCIAGQSASTSETGSTVLQQEHSAVLACSEVESAVVPKRR
ncbi:hypothetical protein BGZ92_005654, partial [Podila epicladia]